MEQPRPLTVADERGPLIVLDDATTASSTSADHRYDAAERIMLYATGHDGRPPARAA